MTIHCIEHARLALTAGHPVTLLSAPAAAVYAGPGWWRALIRSCATEQPDLLDCADAPGRALEALALGCRRLVLRPCPAWHAVAERAEAACSVVLRDRPATLDLAGPGAARRIAAWLRPG